MGEGCKLTIDGDLPIETRRRIFGGFLRAAREGRGRSLTELVHATRISPNFVTALELGDFDALPGRVFGRGFIKNLCVSLDIPSTELLEAYDLCWDDGSGKVESHGLHDIQKVSATTRRVSVNRVSYGLAAAVLVGVFFGVFSILKVQKVEDVQVAKVEEPLVGVDEIQNAVDSQENKEKESLATNEAPKEPAVENVTPDSAPERSDTDDVAPQDDSDVSLKSFTTLPINSEKGLLAIRCKEEIQVSMAQDGGDVADRTLPAGVTEIVFEKEVSLVVSDVSKVEVELQGRPLGELGMGERKFQFLVSPKPVYAQSTK